MAAGERQPIEIVDYDPDWPARFAHERTLLQEAFAGADVKIEHVGSTAVPGLAAKPIIDIMVGVTDLDDVEHRIDALRRHGYAYVPAYEAQLPERRYFRKPAERPRHVHLHVVVRDGDFWRRHLRFRDQLREHPEVAAAYAREKRRLGVLHPYDHAAYTEGKTPFIEAALARTCDGGAA